MSSFQEQYRLWDEFLDIWPLEKLANMTIDEYTNAGGKDTFTYWIEAKLSELGSIWGGSAFKFGVFSRKDNKDKESNSKLSYSDQYGWYTSLGNTAETAFDKIRKNVVQIAKMATEGNLEGIEDFQGLGEATKWKIAFHYQNRKTPTIVGIYKKAPLALFLKDSTKPDMGILQKDLVDKRPDDLGILEFGQQVWGAWSEKNLVIWKLSHGTKSFTPEEHKTYRDDQWAVMHEDTGKGQGKEFIKAPIGTLFFLCHGSSLQLIGQFTSEAVADGKGYGWIQRRYRILKKAVSSNRYTVNSKYWSPQGNSTFGKVGPDDLPVFEETLLKPYFNTDLAELAGLAGEDIVENMLNETPVSRPILNTDIDNSSEKAHPTINRIYYGPPGTGKTYRVQELLRAQYIDNDNKRYEFITFHQSYGYEEFVEGLRPVINSSETTSPKDKSGEVHYEIRQGAFLRLCKRARQNPNQQYAMVIDEINRGNISKIFGELITLVEVDKREGAKHQVEVTLPYSGDSFSIPLNIDVIGTMNTADRSLALVDTALRRRFEFKELMPKPSLLKNMDVSNEGKDIDIALMLATLNHRIEALYDRDHTIGHAYFMVLRDLPIDKRFAGLKTLFKDRIIPLLEEYFFEDWQKIRMVLGDNQKSNPNYQFVHKIDQDEDLTLLFGNDHGLNQYTIRSRYGLNSEALEHTETYLGVYNPV